VAAEPARAGRLLCRQVFDVKQTSSGRPRL